MSDASPVPPSAKPRPAGSISSGLRELLAARPDSNFQIRDLFEHLAGRGHATLMVVMSLPLCLPIPFGPSVVIGPVLVFVGLRFAFGHRPWLPRWVLQKPLRREIVVRLSEKCLAIERRTVRLIRPRHVEFCRNVWMHRILGVTVALLGALLPLPVPFTNIPLAILVIIIGLSLLEDDGLFAVIGLALSMVAFAVLGLAAWLGTGFMKDLLASWL